MKKKNDEKKNLTQEIKIKQIVKKKRIIPLSIIVIAILIIGGFIFKRNNDLHKITVRSSLQKINNINELSTIQYTYNAIARKNKDNEEKNNDNIEYYVKYEGNIKAGFDFKEIKIKIKDKKIEITLPEVTINDLTVNTETLEYIFKVQKKENDSVSQEALRICKEDLKQKVEQDENLKKIAKENAISTLKGLMKPWINSLDEGYSLEIN